MAEDNITRGAFFLHAREREQAINAVHQHDEEMKKRKYFTYKVNDKLRIQLPVGTDIETFLPKYLAKIEESHHRYQ